jgi:hypothetical protein
MEPGWGARRSKVHPTPPLISFAATLPLQGRVKTYIRFMLTDIFGPFLMV